MLNEDYRDILHALSDEGVAKKWSRIRLTDSMKSKTAKVKGVPDFLPKRNSARRRANPNG